MLLNRCPECHSDEVKCERQIGCILLLIIFVSFGLGLLLVPFAPKVCTCKACGAKWKP